MLRKFLRFRMPSSVILGFPLGKARSASCNPLVRQPGVADYREVEVQDPDVLAELGEIGHLVIGYLSVSREPHARESNG